MANFYNISQDILTGAGQTAQKTTEIVKNSVCGLNFTEYIYFFLLPLIFLILAILIFRYRDIIKIKYLGIKSGLGYVKILFIKENKKIKEKLVKLDKYNTFNIGNRKYSLEKMYDFIIGYDKNNFPVFMYNINFILPLKIEQTTITEDIKKSVNLSEFTDKEKDNKISQIIMSIDSTILKTVYDKKLISDLYSISGDNSFKKILLYGGLAIVGFTILYYTGLLDKILNYLGVQL